MLKKTFATFLITFYATNDKLSGLFGILDKWRSMLASNEHTKGLDDCPYCFSIWAGALIAFVRLPRRVIDMLALAGAVVAIYEVRRVADDVLDLFYEDEVTNDSETE